MQRWFFADEREVCHIYHERTPSPPTSPRSLTPRPTGQFHRPWYFCVEQPNDWQILGNECLAIVGDCDVLGNWNFLQAVAMQRRGKEPKDCMFWETEELWIPRYNATQYRYCIIAENGEQRIIRFWETHRLPRVLPAQVVGVLDDRPRCADTFGHWPECKVAHKKIERGWLTSETVIQFKFFQAPFVWPPGMPERLLHVRVTPLYMAKTAVCAKNPRWFSSAQGDGDNTSKCFAMSAGEQSTAFAFNASARLQPCEADFRPQPHYGSLCSGGDILLIHCTVGDFENTAYRIDFFTFSSKAAADEPAYHYGYQYVEAKDLWPKKPIEVEEIDGELEEGEGDELEEVMPAKHDCEGHIATEEKAIEENFDEATAGSGKLRLAIMCGTTHRPIGMMEVAYVVVKPCEPPLKLDMSTTYQRYWNPKYTGIDVGRRGCGPTFNSPDGLVREDTLYSLKRAASHGADMVNVNVHLTKDLHPVLHTLFTVMVATVASLPELRHLRSPDDFEEIPIWEFNQQELKHLHRIDSLEEGHYYRLTDADEENAAVKWFCHGEYADNQPFTLLTQVLEHLDPYVACFLDVRWPQMLASGEIEGHFAPTINKNVYMDAILHTVFQHAGQRRIIFGSLDADASTMLRLKQNLYPVMFEVPGQMHPERPIVEDVRSSNFAVAVFNAQAQHLLGIVTGAKDLLLKTELKHLCRSAEFVLFGWGSELKSKRQVDEVKKLGLEGVIYDRIDKIIGKPTMRSVFAPPSDGPCCTYQKRD